MPEVITDAAIDAQASGPVPAEETPQAEATEQAEKPVPEQLADETDHAEQEDKPKRKGGWQRKIEKLEQEVELWREQALKGQPSSQPSPTTSGPTKPVAPKLSTFAGTVEEFERAQEEYAQKLEAYTEQVSQQRQALKRMEEATASFAEKLQSLEDYDDLDETAQEHLDPNLTKWLAAECALVKNGHSVFRELVMDPDYRAELLERARLGDAAGIKGQISALGIHLRKTQASAPEAEKPAPRQKPKPPTPVTKPAPTEVNWETMSPDEYTKKRNAELLSQGKKPW